MAAVMCEVYQDRWLPLASTGCHWLPLASTLPGAEVTAAFCLLPMCQGAELSGCRPNLGDSKGHKGHE